MKGFLVRRTGGGPLLKRVWGGFLRRLGRVLMNPVEVPTGLNHTLVECMRFTYFRWIQ